MKDMSIPAWLFLVAHGNYGIRISHCHALNGHCKVEHSPCEECRMLHPQWNFVAMPRQLQILGNKFIQMLTHSYANAVTLSSMNVYIHTGVLFFLFERLGTSPFPPLHLRLFCYTWKRIHNKHSLFRMFLNVWNRPCTAAICRLYSTVRVCNLIQSTWSWE